MVGCKQLHSFSSVAIALMMLSGSAFAQTKQAEPKPSVSASTQPKRVDVPPPRPTLEADRLEPAITIRKVGEDTHEEYRIRGKLYMIKVTPKKGTPYYLVDRQGDGNMVVGDNYAPPLSVPKWVLFEF